MQIRETPSLLEDLYDGGIDIQPDEGGLRMAFGQRQREYSAPTPAVENGLSPQVFRGDSKCVEEVLNILLQRAPKYGVGFEASLVVELPLEPEAGRNVAFALRVGDEIRYTLVYGINTLAFSARQSSFQDLFLLGTKDLLELD